MSKVKITETIIRDAHQSRIATRMTTEEMLPAEWSEEQKTEFIEDGKRRLKKSRWMIVPIFAFLITFGVDALELFVFPFFRGLFS